MAKAAVKAIKAKSSVAKNAPNKLKVDKLTTNAADTSPVPIYAGQVKKAKTFKYDDPGGKIVCAKCPMYFAGGV